MTRESADDDAAKAMAVPLLQFLGARFDGWDAGGRASVSMTVSGAALNANDRLHAGTLSTLLDVTAYLALLPTLEATQTAATHNVNASFFGSVQPGSALRFQAYVVHRGRSLAVIQSEAFADERRVALATLCKSIIVLR